MSFDALPAQSGEMETNEKTCLIDENRSSQPCSWPTGCRLVRAHGTTFPSAPELALARLLGDRLRPWLICFMISNFSANAGSGSKGPPKVLQTFPRRLAVRPALANIALAATPHSVRMRH